MGRAMKKRRERGKREGREKGGGKGNPARGAGHRRRPPRAVAGKGIEWWRQVVAKLVVTEAAAVKEDLRCAAPRVRVTFLSFLYFLIWAEFFYWVCDFGPVVFGLLGLGWLLG
ncbi:hypothetical protein V6Z11_A02G018400 [Gossypium hirsutum]